MAEPMYRQIAEDLQHKIEAGELERGAHLATEIELQRHYDASRNTIREAIKWLVVRGLVETRPGQGTFVTERITPFVTVLTGDPTSGGGEEAAYIAEVVAAERRPEISEPRLEIQLASDVVASALRVEPGAPVVSRHQQRYIDGTSWSLQTSFYPISLVERGATQLLQPVDIPEGTVAYLADQCGVKQASYQDSISVRTPDAAEAAFFKLPADGQVAVFEIFRLGFDESGCPFRLTVIVYPADRNRLLVNVGPVPQPRIEEKNN